MSPATSSLKPADLYLLLALADVPMHGYALAQRMAQESEGRVRMLPGNLYAVIPAPGARRPGGGDRAAAGSGVAGTAAAVASPSRGAAARPSATRRGGWPGPSI